MLIPTLLNTLESHKSFIFCDERFEKIEGSLPNIVVSIRPRKGSLGRCPECGKSFGVYETQAERRFEYRPLFEYKVFFVYAPRRVRCPVHGVKVESMPWCTGKGYMVNSYKLKPLFGLLDPLCQY